MNTAAAGRVSPDEHDTAWHVVDVAATAEMLESGADGLSSREAEARLDAHAAVLHWAPLQRVFRTMPLDLEQWGIIILVGTTVVLGGELDKARNRYLGGSLG